MATIGAGACFVTLFGLGPLDPPAGAVDENGAPVSTQPTLAELEAKIDALGASAGGIAGPWEVATVSITNSENQRTAQLFIPGRVYVHRVHAWRLTGALFDGPGSIDGLMRVTTGEPIASFRQSVLGANGSDPLVSLPVEVVAENGVYLAYDPFDNFGLVQVYYKTLDP